MTRCKFCSERHDWSRMTWVGIQQMPGEPLELRNDPHGSTRAWPIRSPRIIDVEVLSVEEVA